MDPGPLDGQDTVYDWIEQSSDIEGLIIFCHTI